MNPPVQSQSLHVIDTESSGGGPSETPQYSDFDQIIENEFGIINGIGALFAQSSDPSS
jgi:hypothetical protein